MQIFHHKRIHRAIVVRDFDETMNYILCGGLPEYPLQQCEKSWTNVNQDDYNIRDYHMLSHNESTNIDLYHIQRALNTYDSF